MRQRFSRPLHWVDTYGGPLLRIPPWYAEEGDTLTRRGGALRRFDTKPPPFYCGIDVHARTLDVCLLTQDGELRRPRHLNTSPETRRRSMAPSRADLGVAVDGLVTGYGLAALWAQEGMPWVRGHALSMTASPGGNATHDTRAAPTSAGLLRGGLRPPASVDPAARRAPPDLRRRRRPRMRQRAERLTPIPHPHRPDHRPEMGQKLASKAHRAGGRALTGWSHGVRDRPSAPRPEPLSPPAVMGRARRLRERRRWAPTVQRVRPLPRAGSSRLNGHRSAAVWRRTGCGDSHVSRPQKTRGSLCHRRLDGDRAARRGWRRHVPSALADANHVGTRGQRPLAPG
jgi:hypothetical protein